jgi:hypothetical protein
MPRLLSPAQKLMPPTDLQITLPAVCVNRIGKKYPVAFLVFLSKALTAPMPGV